MNTHPLEQKSMGVRKLVPTRIHSTGPIPGMNGQGVMEANLNIDEQWISPISEPSNQMIKKILIYLLAIGTKMIFSSHVYTINIVNYLQINGGPIVLKYPRAVAKVSMRVSARKFFGIL